MDDNSKIIKQLALNKIFSKRATVVKIGKSHNEKKRMRPCDQSENKQPLRKKTKLDETVEYILKETTYVPEIIPPILEEDNDLCNAVITNILSKCGRSSQLQSISPRNPHPLRKKTKLDKTVEYILKETTHVPEIITPIVEEDNDWYNITITDILGTYGRSSQFPLLSPIKDTPFCF